MLSRQSIRSTQAAFLTAAALAVAAPGPAAASFLFKKGSFNKTDNVAVPVDQQVTGVGFQPKAVIFFYTRQLATGVAPDIGGGWGFATGPSNERAIATGTADAQAAPAGTHRAQSITNCIVIITSGALPTLRAEAELVQFEPDGFRIRWTINEARQDIIHYIALGGSDITNAVADHFAVTGGTGIQPVPVGFQPDYIMLLSARMSSLDVVAADAHHSIGFATSPTARAAIGVQMEHQDPGRDTCVWQRTDSILLFANGAGNICPGVGGSGTERFDLSAFTPTGFNVDKLANGLSGEFVHYLALKGGRYRVGNFPKNNTLAAPPDVDQPVTGVSFRPVGVMLTSDNLPPIGPPSTVQAEGRISFGASDLATNGATWWHDRDGGLDPSDSNMRTSTTQIAVHASGVGGATVDAAGFLKSFDPDGFTLTWTANNTGAGADHQILYAAFGDSTNYRSIGTAANYTTSTVNATLGSRTVTGAGGTAWRAANRGRGDRITIPCPDPPTCTGGSHYTVLAVNSDAQLTLTTPFGSATGPYSYMIARQFTTLAAWEDCISFTTPCTFFPVASANLATDNRSEVGVAYKETALAGVVIDGSTTDAAHTITLTADHRNRHHGVAGNGVVIDNGAVLSSAVELRDDFVTVDWLEIKGGGAPGADGIHVDLLTAGANANQILVRQNLIHNVSGDGIEFNDSDTIVDAYNNIIYRNGGQGIRITAGALAAASRLRILNNSVFANTQEGVFKTPGVSPATVLLRNNIAHSNGTADFAADPADSIDPVNSTDNLASDPTATTHSPGGGGINSAGSADALFMTVTPGSEDLHLEPAGAAVNQGVDLSGTFIGDIDNVLRQVPWEIGADDTASPTEVDLVSFAAVGLDGAVELRWETASEINNLGFYLYRSGSSSGPFERITPAPIPGLGSSPVGARYRYVDQGVVNGRTYHYLLEDYETTGKTERHGPVSATPRAGAPSSGGGSEPPPGPGPSRITYGNPSAVSLRILERSERELLLELTTGGFFAEPLPDGSVRLSVPGFVEENPPGSPAIPTRRTWLEAVAGRRVQVASVRALDVSAFSSLRPLAAEGREIVVSRTGALRPGRRHQAEGLAFRRNALYPQQAASILETAFQGETKKALLELAPLRWDPTSQQLLLAQRLLVRVVFTGREPHERSGGGSRGREYRERGSHRNRGVVARLGTHERGLYAVRFEDLFGARGRGLDASRLRLGRQGVPAALHVEPDPSRFGPGSALYFVSEGASVNPYGTEAVYELELGEVPGLTMPTGSATPHGPSLGTYLHRLEREENRFFAAQLDFENFWPWASILASTTKSFPFDITRLAPSTETVKLELWLLGVTVNQGTVEHTVRLFVNGHLVAEPSWSATSPELLTVAFSPTLLQEGPNTLAVENANSFYSAVMLDRFAVSYPRLATAEAGVLEGRFTLSGAAEVSGLSATPVLLDLEGPAPRWLTGVECAGGTCRFRAEAGRPYLAAQTALRPSIERALPSRLKSTRNRYDYLVVGPQNLLEAAEPLLQLRRNQGLSSLAVPIEQVFDEFGFGETNPRALRDFLAYAFHHWSPPAARYVLLLGDGTYDYKDHLQTGVLNQVPPVLFKSSYIWTASDPLYAAVNGEDSLPDLAIGRLPASTIEEARSMVEKILAFEAGGHNFDGSAVLVADNPDQGGDFEADAEEIASTLLASRNPSRISLAQLGVDATRAAILDAFDQGPSLLSYLGHGGQQLWAHESIFHASGVGSLAPQSQQPLVLTMNCLNGYFQYPYYDSLAEELVKAEGKGAIAAFSPSGLSLNDAAHVFHKAFLAELTQKDHPRLGDVVLAAQDAYADTGAFPELIGIYHLLGDPALRIR